MRNFKISVCPACGIYIPFRKELPFLTRRAWREKVADKLGYDKDFIINLGEKTRIHKHHFADIDVRNGKPFGVPQFEIELIEDWPKAQAVKVEQTTSDSDNILKNIKFEAETDENTVPKNEPSCVLVELTQLKLLLRQCYYCSHTINESSLNYRVNGGIFLANYWCSTCKRKRFWRSYESPIVQLMTSASMLTGIGIAKVVQFFAFLQCTFPSTRSLYYAAQVAVRPMINHFYELQNSELINYFQKLNKPLHLCLNIQYDSPGYSAQHCTLTAIELLTHKIIGFYTIKRGETNKSNIEPLAFRYLLKDLLSKNLQIASVTTDSDSNPTAINKFFETEHSNIQHFLNLSSILKNMYAKFSLKFNDHHPNLKPTFTKISKFIWKCGKEHPDNKDKDLMLEKCLSILLHIVGVHEWKQGRFVDIFNNFVQYYDFPQTAIQNVWMRNCLSCDHKHPCVDEDILDPFSNEYSVLLEDMCSDSRLHQLRNSAHIVSTPTLESYYSMGLNCSVKRYHLWYLDVRTMLAILRYNGNIQIKDCKNVLSDCKNNKSQIASWQMDMMEYMKQNGKVKNATSYQRVEITEETNDVESNEEIDRSNDPNWMNFLEQIVN